MKILVTEDKETYEYLLKYYDINVMKDRLRYWYHACKKVIEREKLTDIAVINKDALLRMVLCYFSDIVRVKEFHDIDDISDDKKYAFCSFWFLRLHPIQLTDADADSKYTFINEKVVLHVIACEYLDNVKNRNAAQRYIKHLFHHLKYRMYNTRTLELSLEALSIK